MPQITSSDQLEKERFGNRSSRSNSLSQLEAIIHDFQHSYVEIGKALAEIQEKRLYKDRYPTFELYCEKRWGFERQTAYDYIHAAEVNVRICVQNPPSLSQARELARLNPDQQRDLVAKIDFSTATVKDVQHAVNGVLGRRSEPKPGDKEPPKEISLEDVLDKLVSRMVLQPYGYYGAKFAIYSQQHPAELENVEVAKTRIWMEISKIATRKVKP